jgi:1,4-dihydroxy-2-naphthoyl-CoA hydrolase
MWPTIFEKDSFAMSSEFVRPPALDLEIFAGRGAGPLSEKMGIQFHKLTADHSTATMPVEGNTQSFGILHGGAYVVIGESLGSIAANIHAGEGRNAVGIEINATHTGSASHGFVIAECRSIHLGRTLTSHEIVVRDEGGRRLSTIRITNLIKESR